MDVRALAEQPTLTGSLVDLEPTGEHHLAGLLPLFAEPEELDGPLGSVAYARARRALEAAQGRSDRADWAIVLRDTGRVVGEAVLFDLDEANESMEFRIALAAPEFFDRGYGTEATQLVRNFGFGVLGLHRLSLHVSAANLRALRVYEKAGFVLEGRRRAVTRVDGQWIDELDLALLAGDPRP